MAVAEDSAWPWRIAWMRPRGRGGHDAAGGGGSLPPTGGGDSTTSGTTTITTTTTSDSGGEPRPRDLRPFTAPVVEEIGEEELYVAIELAEDKEKKLEHIKGLVEEFHGHDHRASERWLSELNAGWVLQLAGTHESSGSVVASHGFRFLVETWILVLRKIGESILTSLDGWYSQSQSNNSQDQDDGASKQPSASEFAQLIQATVLKMLPFVDIIAATKTARSPVAVAPGEKLHILIDMHDTLSMVSQQILSLLQVESIDGAMGDLLSADLTKLDEAIWGTIVEIMNIIMAWTWTDAVGGSSEIHKVTNSIVSYTEVLWSNYRSVNRVLHDASLRGEFVSENGNVSHVSNLIMETVSSLEIRPSTMSSFPDHESLRFLFLINNLYYLLQQFRTIWRLDFAMVSLNSRINDHINSYLHVSWAPVLKCLQDPVLPCCFTRYSSPMLKFELKFQKTYASQKLCKVPDPEMRRRLRKHVIDKVVPVFTQFLEDNSVVAPRFTPRKLEKMLRGLFEG